jgi:F0F1-type ATP synthase epsilon subunit
MAQIDQMTQTPIHLILLAPEKTLYSGDVQAITCHNYQGEFDILPFHSNFVSLIDSHVILHTAGGKVQKIEIGKALLKASENSITILLDIDLTERDILFKALFQQIEDNKQSSTSNPPQKKT